MKKLYYFYIELPIKVRFISKCLQMDHVFSPHDNSYYDANIECPNIAISEQVIGMQDLFNLANTKLFDHIFVFVGEDNFAYYRDNKKNKIIMNGWIDITQFEDGGHYTNDPLFYSLKDIK